MTRQADLLARVENAVFERLRRRADRPSWRPVTVTSVDVNAGTFRVRAADTPTGRTVKLSAAIPGYLPTVGATIQVQMSGSDPIPQVGPGTLAPTRSISSIDYVPGVSGWAIFANGNAEFNDIIARGDIDVIEGPDQAINGGFEEATTGGAAAGPNLIGNPGAEVNAAGWTGSQCTITRSTSDDHSGVASFLVFVTEGEGINWVYPYAISDPFDVEPDTEYEFEVWTKGQQGASLEYIVLVYNDDESQGTLLGTDSGSESGSTWKRLNGTETTPEWADHARVYVRWYSQVFGDTHRYDDVLFRTPAVPAGIPGWVNTTPGVASADRSTAQQHSGAASLILTSLGAGTAIVEKDVPISVAPGDWWVLRSWNRTPQLSVVNRARWLDDSLAEISVDDGGEPSPILNNVWSQAVDTFKAPDNAAYLVPQVRATFTAASQSLHVDDYEHRRVGAIQAKIVPRGAIEGLDISGTTSNGSGTLSTSYTSRLEWLAFVNPGRPIKVLATIHFDLEWVGTVSEVDARVGISFDDGTSWSYSTEPKTLRPENVLGDSRIWGCLTFSREGVPTDDILVRLEALTTSGTVRLRRMTGTALMVPA